MQCSTSSVLTLDTDICLYHFQSWPSAHKLMSFNDFQYQPTSHGHSICTFGMKEACWKLHGNLNVEVAFGIKLKAKSLWLFWFCNSGWQPKWLMTFIRNASDTSPRGRSSLHRSTAILPVFLVFLFFFSFSTQARQMGINRKSRKALENKLVVKCSRLNFYFKRNFWNRGREGHTSHKNFEAWALWMWSSKLRWRVSGRMLAARIEDKRSKTVQMNGTNKWSAVNTTWHLYREAKPCSALLFLTIL